MTVICLLRITQRWVEEAKDVSELSSTMKEILSMFNGDKSRGYLHDKTFVLSHKLISHCYPRSPVIQKSAGGPSTID